MSTNNKSATNDIMGDLEKLMQEDTKPQAVLTHLAGVHNAADNHISRTKNSDGKRLSPINFRLTNQPTRINALNRLLSSIQAKTKKDVTLGLFMSALCDNQDEFLSNEKLITNIIESMRDM